MSNNQLNDKEANEIREILTNGDVSEEKLQKILNSQAFKTQSKKIEEDTKETKINLLLLGGTGVGKSSLVNRMFGEELVTTSNIKPDTRGINKIESEKVESFRIYDSEGYEIGGEELFKNNLDSFLQSKKDNQAEFPHCVIYCLQIARPRIEDIDIKAISLARNTYNLPVIVALTKFDTEKKGFTVSTEFKRILIENGINEQDIFTLTGNDHEQIKKYDQMRPMIKRLGEKLNEYMEQQKLSMYSTSSYQHEYKQDDKNINFENTKPKVEFKASDELYLQASEEFMSVEEKLEAIGKKVDTIIKQHTATAMAAVVTPIPIADSIMLITDQVVMAGRIFKAYKIKSPILIAQSIVPKYCLVFLGKFFVASLLNFIPFLGNLAAGVIQTGIATGLTYAFGRGLKYYCEVSVKENKTNLSVKEAKELAERIDLFDVIQQFLKSSLGHTTH